MKGEKKIKIDIKNVGGMKKHPFGFLMTCLGGILNLVTDHNTWSPISSMLQVMIKVVNVARSFCLILVLSYYLTWCHCCRWASFVCKWLVIHHLLV